MGRVKLVAAAVKVGTVGTGLWGLFGAKLCGAVAQCEHCRKHGDNNVHDGLLCVGLIALPHHHPGINGLQFLMLAKCVNEHSNKD